ncbi:Serine-protein kinase RsbW [Phaeobacter sp. CECT 5382]|uniref:ATP-binding protein n=1 Tax=Phaeobacter sp. CECT 5382 TaxID=1712645 RepID=UPI0006DA04BF|nr:ATP-binding protein [Phaeobacter sp. CECT 5382]CUH86740.1 Serine-protein kinase RsbW [Phaeobacter sp. CECT 5382]
MADTFACSFTATELDARSGISLVVKRLRDFNLPEERVGDVQIALAEAVNNVVEHAYSGQATGDVRIRCDLEREQLWIRISDAGPPFPDDQLPAGERADVSGPLEDLPEGGFGWFLIRELTNRIHYERQNGNNQLSLCFELSTLKGS